MHGIVCAADARQQQVAVLPGAGARRGMHAVWEGGVACSTWVVGMKVAAPLPSTPTPTNLTLLRPHTPPTHSTHTLHQALIQGQTPFQVWSGGPSFWEWLEQQPRMGATFDAAMQEMDALGAGEAVVGGYRWVHHLRGRGPWGC